LDPTEKVGEDVVVTRVTKVEVALDGGPGLVTKPAVGLGKGVVGGEDNIQDQASILDLETGVVDGGREGDFGGTEQGLFRKGGGEMTVQHEIKVLSSCGHVHIAPPLLETAGKRAESLGEVSGFVVVGGKVSHQDELVELFRGQGSKVGGSVRLVSACGQKRLEGLAALTVGDGCPLLVKGWQVFRFVHLAKTHPDKGSLGENDPRAFGDGGESAS
jgi:hypothetical protein